MSVDKTEASKAIAFLERVRALPQERRDQEPASGFLISREEQRLKLQRGIASNLEQTLYTIDGVREARVHLNLPEKDPLLGREMTPGSASVLIIFEVERGMAASDIPNDVAKLVAGAAGISPASVAVLVSQVTPASPIVDLAQDEIGGRSVVESVSPSKRRTLSIDPSIEIALSLLIIGIAGVFTVVRRSKIQKAA